MLLKQPLKNMEVSKNLRVKKGDSNGKNPKH